MNLFRQIDKVDLKQALRNVPLPEPHLSLLAAGIILHRGRPWRFPLNRCVRHLIGWLLVAGGTALAGWAVSTAGKTDLARSNRLVTHGPFALSRHPMYMGWNCIYFGLALVLNTCWLFILSPLLLVLVHFVALAEEHKLENRFGQNYRTYTKQVGRYL